MFRKIIIADDHYVVRVGTAMALEAYDVEIKIEFAESYYEVEKLLEKDSTFDLLILDINMPGVEKSVIKEIKGKYPHIKIMMFSAHSGNIVLQYIKEGADGYLNKLSSNEQIVSAIKVLFKDGYFFPSEITIGLLTLMEQVNPQKVLSEREYEVYLQMIHGAGNLEITNSLSLHPSTISTYKKRIFKKLGVKSIVELLRTNVAH